ncbi:MAG: TonB-dependent receptor [Saprospiraceae bacterium]
MIRFLLFFLSVLPVSGYTQRPDSPKLNGSPILGSISGTLLDSLTREPIDYASVGIIDDLSGKIINGGISDQRGIFRISELPIGTYTVQISFIGYRLRTLEDIQLSPKRPDADLGKIILTPESKLLDEIMVVGEAAMVEFKPDKLVYNAERDVTSAGGDASDVLRKVPMLTVDFDGNVSLRGSENVKILINGRPSGMFSSNVAEALKMMPADQIKSVEVITAPSAKYDGEGTAGIINIITRKKNIEGLAGSADVTAGTRSNRANVNLNYGRGRLGLNVSGGGNYSPAQEGGTTFLRNDNNNGIVNQLTQNGTSASSRLGFRTNAAAEYNINAFNSLNSSINFRGWDSNNDNNVQSTYTTGNTLVDSYNRTMDGTNERGGIDWDLDYKHNFPNNAKEWTISVEVDKDQNKSAYKYNNQFDFPDQLLTKESNLNNGDNLEITAQSDYIHPLSDYITLETGIKGSVKKLKSDFQYEFFDPDLNLWKTDPERTDVFHYDQNVYAGYGNATIKLGKKVTFIGGLRVEWTDLNGEFDVFQNPFKNHYSNLLPSVTLSGKTGQYNQIKISYNQRIQRPNQRYINPFIEYNDNRDISYGNPTLSPELVHQIEIGSTIFLKGNMINTSLFIRRTEDLIENILKINDLGISESTYYNFGQRSSVGLNVFGSINIGSKLSLRGGFDVNTWKEDGNLDGQALSNTGYDYNGRMNITWAISQSLKMEGFTFFRSPTFTVQGKTPNWSMMSFGVKKELFKKRVAVGINITEPFRENQVFVKELEGTDFYQYSKTLRPVRSFGLILSYRFGKIDFKERTGRKNNDQNDENPVGGEIQN